MYNALPEMYNNNKCSYCHEYGHKIDQCINISVINNAESITRYMRTDNEIRSYINTLDDSRLRILCRNRGINTNRSRIILRDEVINSYMRSNEIIDITSNNNIIDNVLREPVEPNSFEYLRAARYSIYDIEMAVELIRMRQQQLPTNIVEYTLSQIWSIETILRPDINQESNIINDCSICIESIAHVNQVELNCGHTFCQSCLEQYFDRIISVGVPTCALCREPVCKITANSHDIYNKFRIKYNFNE